MNELLHVCTGIQDSKLEFNLPLDMQPVHVAQLPVDQTLSAESQLKLILQSQISFFKFNSVPCRMNSNKVQ